MPKRTWNDLSESTEEEIEFKMFAKLHIICYVSQMGLGENNRFLLRQIFVIGRCSCWKQFQAGDDKGIWLYLLNAQLGRFKGNVENTEELN